MTSKYRQLTDSIGNKLEEYNTMLCGQSDPDYQYGDDPDWNGVDKETYVNGLEEDAGICCVAGHNICDDDALDRSFANVIRPLTSYLRESKNQNAVDEVFSCIRNLEEETERWIKTLRHYGTVGLSRYLGDRRDEGLRISSDISDRFARGGFDMAYCNFVGGVREELEAVNPVKCLEAAS